MTTPISGPLVLPTPPITTMKITSAVQLTTLNASLSVTVDELRWINAPVTPVQPATTTHTIIFVTHTLTPSAFAPGALSRVACSASPSRDRTIRNDSNVAPTPSASATQ